MRCGISAHGCSRSVAVAQGAYRITGSVSAMRCIAECSYARCAPDRSSQFYAAGRHCIGALGRVRACCVCLGLTHFRSARRSRCRCFSNTQRRDLGGTVVLQKLKYEVEGGCVRYRGTVSADGSCAADRESLTQCVLSSVLLAVSVSLAHENSP